MACLYFVGKDVDKVKGMRDSVEVWLEEYLSKCDSVDFSGRKERS